MNTTYDIKPRRAGLYTCLVGDCGQLAVWKGVVDGWFNAGRACPDHKDDLTEKARNLARQWRRCPCPDSCGH